MKKHISARIVSFLLAMILIFAASPLSTFGAASQNGAETASSGNSVSDIYWQLFVKPFLKPTADAEGLPENAKLSLEVVSNPFNRKTGSSNYNFLDFYDIKAVDKRTGKEIHPTDEVEVTITDARIKEGQSVYILHVLDDENVIRDTSNYVLKTDSAFISAFPAAAKAAKKALGINGVAVEIIDDLVVDGTKITFKTGSFSIFAISENPILTVNFYKGPKTDADSKIVSIRVKKSDTEGYPSTATPPVETEFEKILYDPGVNAGLDANILFRGWFENNAYDETDAVRVTDPEDDPNGAYVSGAMTIRDVRDKVVEILNADDFNGGEKDFYAMLYKQFVVTYFDQAGKICLGRDFVMQRAYSETGVETNLTEMDYQVTLTYVPYGQFENFEGWKLKTGDKNNNDGYYTAQAQHMVGIYTTTPPDGTPEITGEEARAHIYATPTWTRISGDIYLQAEAPEGNWLIFDENGKGGTYVAPQFVKRGDITVDPEQNGENSVVMQRYGYTFGGWYDTKEHADAHAVDTSVTEGRITFGQQLTDNKTIYASWVPNATANYTVIIWKQNVAGNGYDFAESITIAGSVGDYITSVTNSGTGNGAYVTVNGVRKQYTGFHLNNFDQNVEIKPEGTSILNVYYDRNVVTLTFNIYSGGTYVHTDATTGDIYGYINGNYVRIFTSDGGQTWYSSNNVEFVEDENGEYGLVDGEYIRLTRIGDGLYYTSSTQYAANELSDPKYGYIDGEYIQLTLRDGEYQYISGTELTYVQTNGNNGTQYGLVDGEYVQIHRTNGNNWYYYTYEASDDEDFIMYGLINGEYVQLERRNEGGWGILNPVDYHYYYNGEEYTGTRYERSETRYRGTRYLRQETDVYSNYNGIIYTHTIPYNGVLYSPDVDPYNGERFVYSGGTGWKTIHQFTGLYGSTLAANGYTWPAEYWWYDDYEGRAPYEGDGTRTTFLDAFILANGASEDIFYGFTSAGSRTVNFYKQNADGSWPALNNPTNTATTGNGTFNISDKYNGYRAYQYSTNGTDWTNLPANPGTNGYYDSVGTYTTLYIRFESRKYNILFMDGQYVDGNNNSVVGYSSRGELHEIENVNYASDLSSYNKGGANYYVPADFAGFVFEGWYLDDACTHPYTFTTMTEGITVYAKWIQVQYRVFLHPNADTDESLDWGSDVQAMNFRINNGGTISVPTGLRDDYVFAGWFTDPGLTQSFIPVIELNETTVTTPYDKTTHYTDPMDKWGNVGENPYNSDINRFWINKEFNLYAKWRAKIVGADGIYVKFVTTDDEGRVGHFASGTANTNNELTEYCDGDIYADGAFGYGLAACGAPEVAEGADELHFRYWVVQRWDASLNGGEGGFFDSDIIVYPGERFDIVYEYAQRVNLTEPDYENEEHLYNYYMVLRAEYSPAIPAETTVRYHANGGTWQSVITGNTLTAYGEGADAVSYTIQPGYEENDTEIYYGFKIEVNKEFNILQNTAVQAVVKKEGYKFLGWSFTQLTTDEQVAAFKQTLAAETADGYEGERTVFAGDGSDPIVGADLRPDEANVLYAVWEIKTYKVVVKKQIENFGIADTSWDDHGFAFHYSVTDGGDYNVTDGIVNADGVSVTNSASGDIIIENVPYGSTLSVWEVLTTAESVDFTTDHDVENKVQITLTNVEVEDDEVTLTQQVVITNTRVTGKIVITKTVSDKNGTEFATEKFVFKLERLSGTGANVVVDSSFTAVYLTLGDGDAASISVPAGQYRVTEITDWSWRYDAVDEDSIDCTIDQENTLVSAAFTNKRNGQNWLSGENSTDNPFIVNGR